jgi:hypothetical protein
MSGRSCQREIKMSGRLLFKIYQCKILPARIAKGGLMSYLIQGLFFQDRIEFVIGYRRGTGETAVMNRVLGNYMFAGAFWHSGPELVGFIQDAFGLADISNIRIGENEIAYRKVYDGRGDPIDYRFTKREGALWAGEYSGRLTGKGIATCLITEVPESFFSPEAIMELLGRTRPFEAPIGSDFLFAISYSK